MQSQINAAVDAVAQEPALVLAPIAALLVSYAMFYEGLLYKLGNERWSFLRSLLPYVDNAAREQGFYTSYTINEQEYVTTIDDGHTEVVESLKGIGAMDAPLAAHKNDWAGREEVSSIGFYGDYSGDVIQSWSKLKRFVYMTLFIRKKLHITMFETKDGKTVVTAHYESSEYNIFTAYKHFRGKAYNIQKGVRLAKDKLEEADLA